MPFVHMARAAVWLAKSRETATALEEDANRSIFYQALR